MTPTCHYAVLFGIESGFDAEYPTLFEGMLTPEGSTPEEWRDSSLRLLQERFKKEPKEIRLAITSQQA